MTRESDMQDKWTSWGAIFRNRLRRIGGAGWVTGMLIAFAPDMLRSAIEYGETLPRACQAHGLLAVGVVGVCLVIGVAFQLSHSAVRGLPAIVREIYQAGYDDAQAIHEGREGGEGYRVRDDS